MLDRFRERLLVVVAGSGALGGCAERAVPGGSESGSQTSTSGTGEPTTAAVPTTGTTDPTGTNGTTGTTGTSEVSAGSDGTTFTPPDFSPPAQCIDDGPDSDFTCEVPAFQTVVYKCGVMPDSGQCADFDTEALVQATNECFGSQCFGPWVWSAVCGPDPNVADACCYYLDYMEGQICPGRPFLVDGACRLADLTARDDWNCECTVAAADAHPTDISAALAAAFAEAARFEHASVASFARFTLELLAVGAPASLVAGAVQATAEELEHARLFFALASHHGGAPVGPGPLAVHGALAATDLAGAALRAAAEGCIAETISAWQASAAARRTRDPALARRLATLAEEELRHCELAWRFVRWALERAPALRPALRALFADAAAHIPRGPGVPEDLDAAQLRAHGLLPRADRIELAAEALIRLVAPAARALLDRPDATQACARA